jgi:hypothetical protein
MSWDMLHNGNKVPGGQNRSWSMILGGVRGIVAGDFTRLDLGTNGRFDALRTAGRPPSSFPVALGRFAQGVVENGYALAFLGPRLGAFRLTRLPRLPRKGWAQPAC